MGLPNGRPTGLRGVEPFVPSAETVISSAVEHLPVLEPNPQPYFFWLHIIDPQPKHLNHLDIPVFGGSKIDRYDHEVRYVDTWLDWFFDTLRKRNDWDRMVVIVAGNRGYPLTNNELGELSEKVTRVPLIIRIPGLPSRPVETTVSLVDLVPTILDLAGLQDRTSVRQKMALSGKSLIPEALGRKSEPRPAFSELPARADRPNHVAWRSGDHKLVFSSDTGKWSLFDLYKDPIEERDISDIQPELSARLQNELRRFRSNLSVIQSDCRAALGQTVSEGWWCKKLGRCTPKEGRCIAASSDDCRASDICRIQGKCVAAEGECISESDTDCRQSTGCTQDGLCTFSEGRCLAVSIADCSASTACTEANAVVHWMGSVWQRVR